LNAIKASSDHGKNKTEKAKKTNNFFWTRELMPGLFLIQLDYLSWLFLQLAMNWCPQLFCFNSKINGLSRGLRHTDIVTYFHTKLAAMSICSSMMYLSTSIPLSHSPFVYFLLKISISLVLSSLFCKTFCNTGELVPVYP